VFHGAGQRLWTSDAGDFALMDTRKIELTPVEDSAEVDDEPMQATGAVDG
jgi:hypothetical protein